MHTNSLRKDLKNNETYYYVDLNIIYSFFEYLSPNDVKFNTLDLEKRKKSILKLIENEINSQKKIKLVISKSVFIEWFQKNIEINWDKNKYKNFKKFVNSQEYDSMINTFKKTHERILKKNSIFCFEWEYKTFYFPKKDSWDHFHVSMRWYKHPILTFDKGMKREYGDSVTLIKK